MPILPEILKQIIVNSGFISLKNYEEAEKIANDLKKPITDILLFQGLISESVLGQLIADYYQVPFISLVNKIIPSETLNLIPETLARTYEVIAFKKENGVLHLAMVDPKNLEIQELIKKKTNLKIIPYYFTQADFRKVISQYKRSLKEEFEKIIAENIKKTGQLWLAKKEKDLAQIAAELPVIKLLDTLLEYAISERASDIHLETMQTDFIVRLRIDGVLRDVLVLPKSVQPALIARIKILSNLKIDEHRIPQDGRFRFTAGTESISLRVSILPAFYGENAVMRLLFESARPLSLEELGLSGISLKLVREAIKKPHGMILVTGPTGCGKTTTLYSLLNMLNRVGVKICTIEDPVEYNIHRLTQIQVNPRTGLTFASGLRSLLRHDPDIMMVGEIRDKETAQIAVHSALTGHLVLSTLHTNDAAGSIPRFIDMGIEPFLLASTINLIIAQRLVRKICSNCLEEFQPDEEVLRILREKFNFSPDTQKFYRGKGCEECRQSGYKGRIGIYEVLNVSEEIRQLTLTKASTEKIAQTAEKQGMITMLQDGFNKIASGLTTIEEVLRAAEV